MKRIDILLLLCLGATTLHAQSVAQSVYAIVASPSDYSTKVVQWQPQADTATLLLRLQAWQPFQGRAAYNPYDRQWQLTGINADGQPTGLMIDLAAQRLLATYPIQGSIIDIQYDLRQRTWWALRQLPNQKGYSLLQWEADAWVLRHDFTSITRILPQAITFDHNRGLYVFVGQDDQGTRRLYRADTQSGQVLDQAPTQDYLFEGLEIDLSDDKLYGIARKRSNVGQYFFVEINPSTAFPTIIIPFVGVTAVASHATAFDQSAGLYSVLTQREGQPWELQEIDVFEGITVRRRAAMEEVQVLYTDNSAYGNGQYK